MLRKRERIFESALNLREQGGRQASQPFDDALLVNRLDLLSHDFRCKRETSRAFRNNNVAGREVGRVFRQRDDNNKLAEVIDAIVRYHNGGPSLFDLDANGGVEVNHYDITPRYAGHLIPPSQVWPRPRRR